MRSGYQHVWPDLEFNWQIVLGSAIAFFGAAAGSVGGIGGGGIYVPVLTLIIGFDAKSATALSKCMVMGSAVSTIYYNLKLRHPTIDMPLIDYDLAVLIQPMFLLGVSLGVSFNVMFPDWLVTVLLIILCIVISIKAFFRGVETWKKETVRKEEASRQLETAEYNLLPAGPSSNTKEEAKSPEKREVSIIENVYWKEFGLLILVWVTLLVLQLIKNYLPTCSALYWIVNLLQIPVAVGVYAYQCFSLYRGSRKIQNGEGFSDFKASQLLNFGFFGIIAGMVASLLGVGGGAIIGPLFLELGIPPQVAATTASFAMMFSSSMSVVEYYLLHRFPVPYALYLFAVAAFAALVGQYIIRRLIAVLGRASIIIFVLSFTIFISAIAFGGVGISSAIGKIQRNEYMGFDSLCKYDAH